MLFFIVSPQANETEVKTGRGRWGVWWRGV